MLLALACVLAYLPLRFSYFVISMQSEGVLAPWRAAVGAAIMCGLFLVYIPVAFQSVRWPLVVLAVLTLAPYVLIGPSWPYGLSGLLISALLLRLRPPVSIICCGLVLVGDGLIVAAVASPSSVLLPWLIQPLMGLGSGLALFAVVRLYELVRQARVARQELIALEVGRERARIAATLRAELGVTLSSLIHRGRRLLENPDREMIGDLVWLAGQMTTQARSLAQTQRTAEVAEPPKDEPGSIAPRLAWFLMLNYAAYCVVISVWNLAWFGLGLRQWLVAIAALVAAVAMQMYHGFPRPAGSVPRRWPLTLGIQLLVLMAASFYIDYVGLQTMFFLAGGTVLLRFRAPWSWALVALLPLLTFLFPMPEPTTVVQVGYRFLGVLTISIAVFALCRLPEMHAYLRSTRGEVARMAVFGERLRLTRDIHDLLSFHLSGLSIKAELVKRLHTDQSDQARAYLRELLEDAQRALGEVRSIGVDPVEPNLKDELTATRALLTAAGIHTTVCMSSEPLPAHIDTLLATVLRESVTNLIRHSAAQTCTIEITAEGQKIRLRVSNDGAAQATPTKRPGSGLTNLNTRVTAVGGLTTEHHDDHLFTLTAEVPTVLQSVGNGAEPDEHGMTGGALGHRASRLRPLERSSKTSP